MYTVLAIFGGNSTEHDISVITAVEALNSMPAKGYRVVPAYLKDGEFYSGSELFDIKAFTPFKAEKHKKIGIFGGKLHIADRKKRWKAVSEIDCALLLTHGGEGENGALQGFLELNRLPYTSADVRASAICMDKHQTKLAAAALGVPVLNGKVILRGRVDAEIEALEQKIGYPMFVKPLSQGSSIGCARASDREELTQALAVALEYDERAIVEKCLEKCVEINAAAVRIGGEIYLSELERPITANEYLTFADKYLCGVKANASGIREFPADLSEKLTQRIKDYTKKLYEGLALDGVVRMDYLVAQNKVYLNEINTIPGSLANYLFPEICYAGLLDRIIQDAIARGAKPETRFKSDVLNTGRGKR